MGILNLYGKNKKKSAKTTTMTNVPAAKEVFVASHDLLASFYEQIQQRGIDVLCHNY